VRSATLLRNLLAVGGGEAGRMLQDGRGDLDHVARQALDHRARG
jgi:hypothetical protein